MTTNTYDQVPYTSQAFAQTHPNRIAAVAALFGIDCQAPSKARILEIGCAAGGNIIPMGAQLPQAEIVGVDFSEKQISAGKALVTDAGINNVKLVQANILDIDATWDKFDYIIAHGVYSWVPEPVRLKLLSIARENLSINGLVYISYNTYPGWRLLENIRGMMLYHVRDIAEPEKKAKQARALLEFMAANGVAGSPMTEALKREAEVLRNKPDNYLLHDHLEENNNPVYFHRFVEELEAAGMRYVSEDCLANLLMLVTEKQAMDVLKQISGGDLLRLEQYKDFLLNRQFRSSLVTHKECEPKRGLTWLVLKKLWITSTLVPTDPQLDPKKPGVAEFVAGDGQKRVFAFPLIKAAFLVLSQAAPEALFFDELVARVRTMLDSKNFEEQDAAEIGQALLEGAGHSEYFASFLIEPLPCISRISDRPRVHELVRLQARSGLTITNMRHEQFLEPENTGSDYRQLISLLDGTMTLADLSEDLLKRVNRDALPASLTSGKGAEKRLRETVRQRTVEMLADLSRAALLVG